ncbi:MAG: restriction endonuclease subunit S [Acidimicrobiaceae bacterium]|nr:restriction endonuclease subunit S [Acidimicrobiaceae bacterium]MYD08325.1 restriction endonuclease subunit S [Acidimicrobiaceae bacterium]MYI58654.1 restriction endonuclease subunit S [Acidimicrobiaceae bacterium]
MTSNRPLPDGWSWVRFGDVVQQVKDKVDPQTAGLTRYVAGEHMDTDDLRLQRWGDVDDGYLGPAFHMRFRPGQVLYGSRRTYLRKVAVADFEGICANTTFVLEPRTADLLPEFLPQVMSTERFHEHSVQQSKGSVNPYINFRDLTWYEFALPPLSLQHEISKALGEFENCNNALALVRTALKSLQNALIGKVTWGSTPERRLTSQGRGFTEPEKEVLPDGWRWVRFGEVVRQTKETTKDPESEGLTRIVGLEHLDPESLPLRRWLELDELSDGTNFTRVFRARQVLFGRLRAYQRKVSVPDFDGVCSGDILVFEPSGDDLLAEFLPYVVQSDAFFDHALGTTAGSLLPRTKWQELAKYELALPPSAIQHRLAGILNESTRAVSAAVRESEAVAALETQVRERLLAGSSNV